jgi:cytochrome c-type biogenesis protein
MITELTLAALVLAFAAGVATFASPCCLPLMPAYLSYMLGTGVEGRADRRRALLHGLAFVLGFSVVFVTFWASIGAVGYVLADHARLLRQLGGAVLIFMGLHVAGVIQIPLLWRDLRPMATMGAGGGGGILGGATVAGGALVGSGPGASSVPGYGRSALFGTMFAAGWSPCIGPILGGILGLATVSASVTQGTVLLIAYTAGLALPFLAVAVGAGWVARHLRWVGRHHRAISYVTATMLIGIGVLMITDSLSSLAAWSTPFGL